MIVTIIAPEPARVSPPARLADAIANPIRRLMQDWGKHLAVLVVFVFLFRLPDLLATPMTGPLLLQHLKFTAEQVGWIRQALGFFITILGAIAGASIVPRIGLIRSLVVFGILQSLSNAGFVVLATQSPNLWLMGSAIAVENFCNGLVGAGFVAFLMSCCDHRYSATQYAVLSGLMASMGLIAGACTGFLVAKMGYAGFFAFSIAAGIPGMLMIPLLGQRASNAAVHSSA